MTEDHRTHYRAALLLQLHAARPNAMQIAPLHTGQQLAGVGGTLADCLNELDALVQLGHVHCAPGTLNAAQKRYCLTEAGRVALSEAGLI